MILYFDTSALIPLLVLEPSSTACRRGWDEADIVVSSRLAYAEAAAALAHATRLGRQTARAHRVASERLVELWSQLDIVEVDQPLVQRAAALARRFGLRGHDAVHCASAAHLAGDDVVAAAGDRVLLDAWSALGMPTYDTNAG